MNSNGYIQISNEPKTDEKIYECKFENGGKKITLGCDNDYDNKGKAEIYNVRAYNRALSMEEVLTNYVSDIEDPIEQNDMIRRNALMGTTSQDLPVMEFYFTEDEYRESYVVETLKRLGFKYVFDVDFAADLTIMEEGYEFLDRLNNGGKLPLITSCSPG